MNIIDQKNSPNRYIKKIDIPINHINTPIYQSNSSNLSQLPTNLSTSSAIQSQEDFRDKLKNKTELTKVLQELYPQFFEEFELISFLNVGGSGVVYEGRMKKKKNKQKLAFKFKYNKRGNTNKIEFQEIGILKKLHYIYITNIYAFTKIGSNMYYCVLELGKHGDLEKFQKILLKKKVLSETILCYFAHQILQALEYIHRCKIIHNDIKQGNIVIDANLDIKITDFSVSCTYANFEPDEVVEFPFMGTSKYIAPEILNRTKMPIREACKIDLYSLGVTLYVCAFGIYPYELNKVENKNYDNIKKNIETLPLTFPKDTKLSPLFIDFLRLILEKDYKKRINIQQALNHIWIKAAKIIEDEKENICCLENFLVKLITDNIPQFNNYISNTNTSFF